MLRLSFSLLGAVGFWGKVGFGAVLGGQFCFASPSRAAGKRSGNAVASSPHHPWGIGFGTHCPVRSCPSTLPGSQIISCSQPESPAAVMPRKTRKIHSAWRSAPVFSPQAILGQGAAPIPAPQWDWNSPWMPRSRCSRTFSAIPLGDADPQLSRE